MAKLKNLSKSQIAALSLLNTGPKTFSRFMDIGIQGSTTAWLVKNGMSSELNWAECGGKRVWTITDAGREALSAAIKSAAESNQ